MFAVDHAATALLLKRRYPSVPIAPLLLAVQAMELKLNVGVGNSAVIEAKSLGRPVEAAGAVKPRGLSIWRPDGEQDWMSPGSDGPALTVLPDNLWILGLGHLGQAFLWALAMCPYSDRGKVSLVLQDMDMITKSSASTSIQRNAGSNSIPSNAVTSSPSTIALPRWRSPWHSRTRPDARRRIHSGESLSASSCSH